MITKLYSRYNIKIHAVNNSSLYIKYDSCCYTLFKLECVMVALPNTRGALCSTTLSLADAHY